MTDTIVDDDLIDTMKPSTSGSNSSITTTRRPLFIETEMRTDTVTKRRVASTTSGTRNVYDILQNTRSPTDGLPPTTYTYAHSVSYMPVTQDTSYSVPVMARRDLHGDYRSYGSTSFSSTSAVFSSPTRFISNVRSQIVNGYSALCQRLTYNNDQQASSTLINSPTSSSSHAALRSTRTSSQSSTNGQTTGYNLRRRAPVHSTPREADAELRKSTTKQRKGRKSQDDINDDDIEEVQNEQEIKETKENNSSEENVSSNYIENILYYPIKLLSCIWQVLSQIPWWLLLLLLLLLGLYVFPRWGCRPLAHYPESKLYKGCKQFQQYSVNVAKNAYTFLRVNTYDRGVVNLKKFSHSILDVKNSVFDSLADIYSNTKKYFQRKIDVVKKGFSGAVEMTTENAKEYCDAGMSKINSLIEEFKREKKVFFGQRDALTPEQEKELQMIVRQLIEEYAADETGQADYALEANGGKIVDTRCTEYTDEPRQNVVKFLGIPIVHMSKQPDIMIKAGRMPGQCFPFKGDHGSVVIKLAVPVKPSEFVLEHLSKSISVVGHINSAPNNFTVYALKDKNDKEGMVLGRYFYDADNGPPLQRFKPQLPNVPVVEYIEVRVTSNWGNPNYTCLYRFRVHGDLQTVQPSAPPAA